MSSFRLRRITITVDKMEAMVAFYNVVFRADLEPFEIAGVTLYQGQLAGVELVFTPESLVGLGLTTNRQQFDIDVPDIDRAIEAVIAYGGTLLNQSGVIGDGGHRIVSIADPDGNTIILNG